MVVSHCPVVGQTFGCQNITAHFMSPFAAFEWAVNMEGLRARVKLYVHGELYYTTGGKRQVIVAFDGVQTVYDNATDVWLMLRSQLVTSHSVRFRIDEVEETTNGAIRNVLFLYVESPKVVIDDDWIKEGF